MGAHAVIKSVLRTCLALLIARPLARALDAGTYLARSGHYELQVTLKPYFDVPATFTMTWSDGTKLAYQKDCTSTSLTLPFGRKSWRVRRKASSAYEFVAAMKNATCPRLLGMDGPKPKLFARSSPKTSWILTPVRPDAVPLAPVLAPAPLQVPAPVPAPAPVSPPAVSSTWQVCC